MALEAMRAEYSFNIMSSEPSERERREQAYFESRALDNLVNTINSFIAIAEAHTYAQPIDEDYE